MKSFIGVLCLFLWSCKFEVKRNFKSGGHFRMTIDGKLLGLAMISTVVGVQMGLIDNACGVFDQTKTTAHERWGTP